MCARCGNDVLGTVSQQTARMSRSFLLFISFSVFYDTQLIAESNPLGKSMKTTYLFLTPVIGESSAIFHQIPRLFLEVTISCGCYIVILPHWLNGRDR